MKAMILAAGRGVRLRPFTDTKPKALVEVGGVPLLKIVLDRLAEAGVREVVINLHHLGDQIEAWISRHGACGLRVEYSREDALLDTGGGLAHAAWFFNDSEPFLVHNVDVLSTIDLRAMVRAHAASGALATLAAMPRETRRPLLFDANGVLCGRRLASGDVLVRKPDGAVDALGFCGIHAISPAVLRGLGRPGPFSIVETYLTLAANEAGAPVRAFRVDGCKWRDAGRPENLVPL